MHEDTNWIAVAVLLIGVILIGVALAERGNPAPADCGPDGSTGAVERLFVCPPPHTNTNTERKDVEP
jgi:hypothetical protein